jgi:tetratricopeptide (TPR) repeat protein
MIKTSLLTFGLLASAYFSTAAGASINNTKNSNKSLEQPLLVQFGVTPTYNQRQQNEAFIRENNLNNQLYHEEKLRQQQKKNAQARQIAAEFVRKRDYIGLGSFLYSNGYLPDAIYAYSMAIEANPKNSDAYFLRARVKGDQKDLRGAIADYDTTIALNPQSIGAYINRAVDKFQLKDKNGSLQDFRSAAQIYKSLGNTVEFENTVRRIQRMFNVPE